MLEIIIHNQINQSWLPWSEHYDVNGRKFYYNYKTGESSWGLFQMSQPLCDVERDVCKKDVMGPMCQEELTSSSRKSYSEHCASQK